MKTKMDRLKYNCNQRNPNKHSLLKIEGGHHFSLEVNGLGNVINYVHTHTHTHWNLTVKGKWHKQRSLPQTFEFLKHPICRKCKTEIFWVYFGVRNGNGKKKYLIGIQTTLPQTYNHIRAKINILKKTNLLLQFSHIPLE